MFFLIFTYIIAGLVAGIISSMSKLIFPKIGNGDFNLLYDFIIYFVLFIMWKIFKKFDYIKLFKKIHIKKEIFFWSIYYLAINIYITSFFNKFIPSLSNNRDISLEYPTILGLISLFIMIPFYEEILFRGILMDVLKKKHSIFVAFVVTGIIFAGDHGKVGIMMIISGSCFYLGYIYVKTKSIWNSIIMHIINNFILVIAIIIKKKNMIQDSDDFNLDSKQLVIFIIVGLLLYSGAIYNFYRMFKEMKSLSNKEKEKEKNKLEDESKVDVGVGA